MDSSFCTKPTTSLSSVYAVLQQRPVSIHVLLVSNPCFFTVREAFCSILSLHQHLKRRKGLGKKTWVSAKFAANSICCTIVSDRPHLATDHLTCLCLWISNRMAIRPDWQMILLVNGRCNGCMTTTSKTQTLASASKVTSQLPSPSDTCLIAV